MQGHETKNAWISHLVKWFKVISLNRQKDKRMNSLLGACEAQG
ncbi:MAG: hypothetical protein OWQ54_01630 [Sulfolobaceae archaeon]|nr:hypothetical protein [Sulfolobaceae archaeon]